MPDTAATETASTGPRWVAPRWHLALLVGLFLALTIGGALFQEEAAARPEVVSEHPDVAPIYLSLIVLEWGLVLYVWRAGLRRTRTTLRDLIGGRWSDMGGLPADAGLALALWIVWTAVSYGWDRWLGPGEAASITSLLPRGVVESLLWVALSLSAGFCEELVFRGYLQKQFEALTRSAGVALCLQAALFGISHGYQGAVACTKIAVYGALFGLLAIWRRSLRPGMMAHAWTDICAGLLRF